MMSKPFRFGIRSLARRRSRRCSPAAPRRDDAAAPRASAARRTARSALRPARWPRSTPTTSPTAIDFAERAVAQTPERRRLPRAARQRLFRRRPLRLGRSRPSRMRCRSMPNQPQVDPEAGAGRDRAGQERRSGRASSTPARRSLDPADYGLALALAGQPTTRVAVLEAAARAQGADARVRQNLALAYALAGDWTKARTVAAQDVPADQLDARIQQWMQLAKPAQAVRPGRGADRRHAGGERSGPAGSPRAASRPTRLARPRRRAGSARAVPARSQAAVARRSRCRSSSPQPQSPAALPPAPRPSPPRSAARSRSARVAAEPQRRSASPPPRPIAPEAPRRLRRRCAASFAAQPKPAAPRQAAGAGPPQPRSPRQVERGRPARRLQLAAACRRRLEPADASAIRRFAPTLPMSARFDSAQGHLLAPVGHRASPASAKRIARCQSLKSRGGSCFVRNVRRRRAGPVRLALSASRPASPGRPFARPRPFRPEARSASARDRRRPRRRSRRRGSSGPGA